MNEQEQMRETAESVAVILSARQCEPLRRLLSDNVVIEYPFAPEGSVRRFEGIEAVLAMIGAAQRTFSSFRLAPERVHVSPGTASVILEARSEGSRTDGGRFLNRDVIIFTFSAGRISLWREYCDPLRLGDA